MFVIHNVLSFDLSSSTKNNDYALYGFFLEMKGFQGALTVSGYSLVRNNRCGGLLTSNVSIEHDQLMVNRQFSCDLSVTDPLFGIGYKCVVACEVRQIASHRSPYKPESCISRVQR